MCITNTNTYTNTNTNTKTKTNTKQKTQTVPYITFYGRYLFMIGQLFMAR